jgi:hypothetical protein
VTYTSVDRVVTSTDGEPAAVAGPDGKIVLYPGLAGITFMRAGAACQSRPIWDYTNLRSC